MQEAVAVRVARRHQSGSLRAEAFASAVVIGIVTHACLLASFCPLPIVRSLALTGLVIACSCGATTVVHDAAHRRFSHRPALNIAAVHLAAPFGHSCDRWIAKHLPVHHRYTSVYGVDDYARDSLVLRLHPRAAWHPQHAWQHLYAWLVYAGYWFVDQAAQLAYVKTGEIAPGVRHGSYQRRLVAYLGEHLLTGAVVAPYGLVFGVARLCTSLLVTVVGGGLITGCVVVAGHVNAGLLDVDPVDPGQSPVDRAVRTTASFSTHSRMTWALTGGMNCHLAHHARPGIARAELPAALEEIAAVAGDPVVFPSFRQALLGHYRELKRLGRPGSSLSDEARERGPLHQRVRDRRMPRRSSAHMTDGTQSV